MINKGEFWLTFFHLLLELFVFEECKYEKNKRENHFEFSLLVGTLGLEPKTSSM